MKLIEVVGTARSIAEYVNDDAGIEMMDGWLKQVEKNCQPFLRQIDYDLSAYTLYRGMFDIKATFFKMPTIQDRVPKNTPKIAHETIDDWCEENFGVKFRSTSLFCSGDEEQVTTYGDTVAIFPIGDFNTLYSKKVYDMYLSLKNAFRGERSAYKDIDQLTDNPKPFSQMFDPDSIRDVLDDNKSTFVKNDLKRACDSGNEIMVSCKSAYVLYIGDKGMWHKYLGKSQYVKDLREAN